MPLHELLYYLASLDDAPETTATSEIITRKGARYVRSREGMHADWSPKYIWVRV